MIRSAVLTHFPAAARDAGLDPVAILRSAGINPATLDHPDKRIAVEAASRVLDLAARKSGLEDFGLRLSRRWTLSILGPVALILREQANVRDLLIAANRYLRLHTTGGTVSIRREKDLSSLRMDFSTGAARGRQFAEHTIGALFQTTKSFFPGGWRPVQACFRHGPPQHPAAYRRHFGAPVIFHAPFDGLVVETKDLDHPIPAADPVLAASVKAYLDSLLEREAGDTASRARELITVLLPTSHCTAGEIAEHLGVERRTMDRQIARSGTTFQTILDDVRELQVRSYLSEDRRALSDIAGLLGFESLASFSRWFRTRFGHAPSAWRRSHASEARR